MPASLATITSCASAPIVGSPRPASSAESRLGLPRLYGVRALPSSEAALSLKANQLDVLHGIQCGSGHRESAMSLIVLEAGRSGLRNWHTRESMAAPIRIGIIGDFEPRGGREYLASRSE